MKTKDWIILGGAFAAAAVLPSILSRFTTQPSATSTAVNARGVEMSELSGNPAGTSIFSPGFQGLVNSIPQSEWDRALAVEPFWTPPTTPVHTPDVYSVAPYSPPETLLPQGLKIGDHFGSYYIQTQNDTLHLVANIRPDGSYLFSENLRFRDDGALIKSGRVDWQESDLRSDARKAGLNYYIWEGVRIAV